MCYLVEARLKSGQQKSLLNAIADGSLGRGSIAGDEYTYDLQHARLGDDGIAHWVETCFCATPLAEERPYWEQFFELLSVKDAHNRKIAATKTVPSLGPAATATAPNDWKKEWGDKANRFSPRFEPGLLVFWVVGVVREAADLTESTSQPYKGVADCVTISPF